MSCRHCLSRARAGPHTRVSQRKAHSSHVGTPEQVLSTEHPYLFVHYRVYAYPIHIPHSLLKMYKAPHFVHSITLVCPNSATPFCSMALCRGEMEYDIETPSLRNPRTKEPPIGIRHMASWLCRVASVVRLRCGPQNDAPLWDEEPVRRTDVLKIFL